MPTPNGPDGDDVDAAERYAEELLARAAQPEDRLDVPSFDVSLLGMGEDGHVASLFPGLPGIHETAATVVAVHGSPKPPPIRISLTCPPCTRPERSGWWRLAGQVRRAPARLGRACRGPAGARRGRAGSRRTLFLLDAGAASRLPRGLDRIDSP